MSKPKTLAELTTLRTRAFHDLLIEMRRGESDWGNNRPDGTRKKLGPLLEQVRLAVSAKENQREESWADVLVEEFLESITATDDPELRMELLQVAAVAMRWVEQIDKRNGVK